MTIENTLSKKLPRDVVYRGVIQAFAGFRETLNEWAVDNVVGRKSRVSIPVIYGSSIPGSSAHLQWEFSTHNMEIVFGVVYQPLVGVATTSWEEKLANRLSKAEPQTDHDASSSIPEADSHIVLPTASHSEVLVNLVKVNSKSASISGSLPVTGKHGVYFFVFENLAVLNSRLVSVKASLVAQSQSP